MKFRRAFNVVPCPPLGALVDPLERHRVALEYLFGLFGQDGQNILYLASLVVDRHAPGLPRRYRQQQQGNQPDQRRYRGETARRASARNDGVIARGDQAGSGYRSRRGFDLCGHGLVVAAGACRKSGSCHGTSRYAASRNTRIRSANAIGVDYRRTPRNCAISEYVTRRRSARAEALSRR
jgi:hypothetical protein